MTSEEVRKLFLSFFEKKGHTIISSSSLIPTDPSVLLTTAGMQQLKPYFTGDKDPMTNFGSHRITSVQKCFRTTDIDEVGDERHLTFFEMLGNFSFGPVGSDNPKDIGTEGYFKKSSIDFAYELITKELGLKIDWVSVFQGEKSVPLDTESIGLWKEKGFTDKNIQQCDRADNFWGPTGDSGPCGPTTEIYVDGIEVWNIVFNQYFQDEKGNLTPLKLPGVDTGMGFERLMKVIQKTETVFETDLFEPLRSRVLDAAKNIPENHLRIILDHVRGSVCMIADGIYPSNLERGYILRRILRRLSLKLKQNNVQLKYVPDFIGAVSEKFSPHYEQLKNTQRVNQIFFAEVEKFDATLGKGLRQFEKSVSQSDTGEQLGQKLFQLYTTFGLPLEISRDIAQERGMPIDSRAKETFDELFQEHQKISKQPSQKA